MTQLYPIGTQLITRRLSQAALAYELGFWVETEKPHGEFYYPYKLTSAFYYADKWRVTVTKKNQTWLSPVPLVGDLVWVENMGMAFEIGAIAGNQVFKSAHESPFADPESGYQVSNFYCSVEDRPKIITRLYPNDQRAPMLEWDEVILPQQGEPS